MKIEKKVCAACGKKIVLVNNKLSYFQISEKTAHLFRKYINSNSNIDHDHYPTAICVISGLALYERVNGKSNRPLLDMPIFENIVLPKATRGREENLQLFYLFHWEI